MSKKNNARKMPFQISMFIEENCSNNNSMKLKQSKKKSCADQQNKKQ